MEQLVYCSRASADLASNEVFRIIETSARNNPTREITGFLIFAHDSFLQLIEGPSASLDALIDTVGNDTRHRNLTILSRRPIGGRNFPNWRMERLSVTERGVDALLTKLSSEGLPPESLEDISEFLAMRKAA